jgi:hypothetical protein
MAKETRLYSLFEKQDGKWVRISRQALRKSHAVTVFQDALLGYALAGTLERRLKVVAGDVHEKYAKTIETNRVKGMMMANRPDDRIAAIRLHPKVGCGSCSRVDECMDDEELRNQLDVDGVVTAGAAVAWALDDQQLFLEMALNARWGESDDPELRAYNKFMAWRKSVDPRVLR